MERRGWIQVMSEVPGVNCREAALRQERLIARGIPDGDMTFDLLEDPPVPQVLHEVLSIRSVQI